jgi:pimeloyl-ACP methyl ester carboxylesterase
MEHRYYVWLVVLVALAVSAGVAPVIRAAPPAQSAVAEEEFTVTLGDGWVSQAKLSYPAEQPGPFPTVLLVSDRDMDFTIPADAGFGPGGAYFKDLADFLASRGIAAVRYHPRYVTGPDDYMNERVGALGLPDFAADAERVLEAMRTLPKVDQQRRFIYGWSFNSSLATYVASRHPDLAGVIVQGATASTETQVFIEDYLENTLPYLIQFAPDGQITPEVLRRSQEGNATVKFSALDLQDPASPDVIKVNPLLDTNGDGVLDISTEVIPNLYKLVEANAPGFISGLRGLPDIYTQAPSVRIPVLVLHGEADTAVRVRNVRGLDQAFAGNPDYMLKIYPGLGHALYPSPNRFEDLAGPMDAQPKADLAAWILARGMPTAVPAQPVALPSTGSQDLPVGWLIGTAVLLLLCGTVVRRRLAGR